MTYVVECDTCDFAHEMADEIDAHAAARDHEASYPTHFVLIEKTN